MKKILKIWLQQIKRHRLNITSSWRTSESKMKRKWPSRDARWTHYWRGNVRIMLKLWIKRFKTIHLRWKNYVRIMLKLWRSNIKSTQWRRKTTRKRLWDRERSTKMKLNLSKMKSQNWRLSIMNSPKECGTHMRKHLMSWEMSTMMSLKAWELISKNLKQLEDSFNMRLRIKMPSWFSLRRSYMNPKIFN